MIIASGYVEVNDISDIEKVVSSLKSIGIEINGIKDEKIVYLIENQDISSIRKEIDALKNIEGVRNVYLTYFSLEGSDEE
ncbi:MAG: chaperone NapD [Thermodesulfovibrionales bacterium]|nr:chaperone NapD [Thermodesulfovibrionales bacterium]